MINRFLSFKPASKISTEKLKGVGGGVHTTAEESRAKKPWHGR